MIDKQSMPDVEEAVRFLNAEGCFNLSDAIIELIENYVNSYKENLNLRHKVEHLQARLYLNGINHDVENLDA
jgi:hypothetical protein